MMRSVFVRLAAVAFGTAIVASCDTRLPGTVIAPVSEDGTQGFPPVGILDEPLAEKLVNIGDSIFVLLRVSDDEGIASVVFTGTTFAGDPDLGTLTQTVRFGPLRAPAAGNFPAGLLDTVIRRYLQPVNPATLVPDSLVISAVVTDVSGRTSTTTRVVRLVLGPKLALTTPAAGSPPFAPGDRISIVASATHTEGIERINVRVQGEANWPTPFDTTISITYATPPLITVFSTAADLPADAPSGGRVSISAEAFDINQQPGSAGPIQISIQATAAPQAPRVTQTVPERSEVTDTVIIRAFGSGIATVGLLVREADGTLVKDTSVQLPPPLTANVTQAIQLNLPIARQGQRLAITAYAIDTAGRTGYAVRTIQSSPVETLANAISDSSLIVYGRTFRLPRPGTVGDIAVDEVLGNVFVSNMDFNRLEVWQNSSKLFDPLGIAVGSQPWGLNVSLSPDTLLVANSGGDNISRVFIGNADPAQMREDLQRRIRTRMNAIFQVIETRDAATGKITLRLRNPPFMYSDRPQYVGQISDGTVYFSTRPTPTRPEGVIRYLDPSQPFPDMRTFLILGGSTSATTFLIVDADDVEIIQAPAPFPDTLVVYGHVPGTDQTPVPAQSGDGVVAAVEAQQALTGSLAYVVPGIEPAGLTDTTFVALSRNRDWIAFGTGNTSAAGNVMMRGPAEFGSPVLSQQDLRNNASERIFGLALDSTGLTVGARGDESYFASRDVPFHLRLQGKYSSFAQGAGMAFHPGASGGLSAYANDKERVAFVASDNFTVEIVDIAHFVNRGRLEVKHRLYGPLRVTRALPTDDPSIVLKLFGIAEEGLVVIDLRDPDIRPVP